jgi:hypothetical protein
MGFGAGGERERCRLCRWPSSSRRGERERCERWCFLWVRASWDRGSPCDGNPALDSSGVQLRRGMMEVQLLKVNVEMVWEDSHVIAGRFRALARIH